MVAIGGGHGLSRTLQAARRYAGEITAVVSVADDGGSSGRLREELGIPAPGDVRRCLGALLPDSSPLATALEYRYEGGQLDGHAFGNLLITVLARALGDFTTGIAEAGRLLGVVGVVLPATTTPVVLKAVGTEGVVEGQVRVMSARGVRQVSLVPPMRGRRASQWSACWRRTKSSLVQVPSTRACWPPAPSRLSARPSGRQEPSASMWPTCASNGRRQKAMTWPPT